MDNSTNHDPEPNVPAEFKTWADAHLAAERFAIAAELDGLIAAEQEGVWTPILDILDDPANTGRASALTPDPEIDQIIKLLEDIEAAVDAKRAQ